MFCAPGINATNGTAQLGEYSLWNVVLNEARITLEIIQIMTEVNFLHEVRYCLNGGLLRQPIPQHFLHKLAPIFMVTPQRLLSNFRQRLAIDFHDQPMRLQVRIHPIQWKTFLDVKLTIRV